MLYYLVTISFATNRSFEKRYFTEHYTQFENYGILLPQFFPSNQRFTKNFTVNQFDEKNYVASGEFLVFPHCATVASQAF